MASNSVTTVYPASFQDYRAILVDLADSSHTLELLPIYYVESRDEWPIYILRYVSEVASQRGLIASGFHGDEPAGPLAILSFLKLLVQTPGVARGWSLTILPIANPTGFATGQHADHKGRNLNRGYVTEGQAEMIAPEVSTIRGFLAGQGFDFALMLHEDVDETEFYLYGFEKAGTEIAKNIVRLAQRYFKIAANDDTDELPMDENGIISDYQDGSLEHWLSTTGIPAAFCTETPGRLPLELRVEANLQFILFLLNWMRVRESP